MPYRKPGYLEQIVYILLWVIKDKTKTKKERTDADAGTDK